MKKITKTMLIIACCLVLIGSAIFASVMSALNWDFTKLSTVNSITNTHEIEEDFSNIRIDSATADINFVLSEDSKCKVVCVEEENVYHKVEVKDDTLTISVTDNRSWHQHSGINFNEKKVTVYLPKTDYDKLNVSLSTGDVLLPKDFKFNDAKIELSTGDVNFSASVKNNVNFESSTGSITLNDISATDVNLSTSTGDITLNNIECNDMIASVTTGEINFKNVNLKNLSADSSTGEVTLANVVANGNFDITTSTGKVSFISCDASEIYVSTDTGSISGSLLSDKVFIASSDTGKVDVPKSTSGGICELTTDTGNITISVEK